MSIKNIVENKRRWSNPEYKKRVGNKISNTLRGRKMSDDTKQKISKKLKGRKTWKTRIRILKGKDHPNWKGGTTPQRQQEYATESYKLFVNTVLQRDDYTCQECGAKNGNGYNVRLNVHHIKSYAENPTLRFDINNGITLCFICHNKTKSKTPKPSRIDKILIKKICQKCGEEFQKRNPQKYCDKCKETICEYCGETFISRNSKRYQKFCSRKCYGQWWSKNKVKENNPHWKGYIEKDCINCLKKIKRRDNEILTNYNKRKFCCLKCAYDYRKK